MHRRPNIYSIEHSAGRSAEHVAVTCFPAWRLWILAIIFLLLPGPSMAADQNSSTEDAGSTGTALADQGAYYLAPKVFRAAMKQVLPSVVTIETYGGLAAPVPTTGSKRQKLLGQFRGISRPGEGPTTGVIVSADGYILTSTYNFLRNPQIITVVLSDGSQHVAKLLGRDNTRKLCLLKIESLQKQLTVADHLSTDQMRVGQWAISVGMGYGSGDPAMSAGIISAKNRISGKSVQTDANISPANYGGPLIDIQGRVIGICVPLNPRGGSTAAGVEWYDSGIGFAIPMDNLGRLIELMKKGQAIEPGRIGISLKPVVPKPNAAPGQTTSGVQVGKVLPKSPGDNAGLKPNDIVVAVDGKKVIDLAHLRTLMGRYVAGDKIKIKVRRGEKEMEFEVQLVAPQKLPQASETPEVPKIIPLPEAPTPQPKDSSKTPTKDPAKTPAKGEADPTKAPKKDPANEKPQRQNKDTKPDAGGDSKGN